MNAPKAVVCFTGPSWMRPASGSLTIASFEGTRNEYSTWTPDGESVTFFSNRDGDSFDFWTKRADGRPNSRRPGGPRVRRSPDPVRRDPTGRFHRSRRDPLAQTKDFAGVTGVTTLDENRNAVKPAVVLQISGGKLAYVETINP